MSAAIVQYELLINLCLHSFDNDVYMNQTLQEDCWVK